MSPSSPLQCDFERVRLVYCWPVVCFFWLFFSRSNFSLLKDFPWLGTILVQSIFGAHSFRYTVKPALKYRINATAIIFESSCFIQVTIVSKRLYSLKNEPKRVLYGPAGLSSRLAAVSTATIGAIVQPTHVQSTKCSVQPAACSTKLGARIQLQPKL